MLQSGLATEFVASPRQLVFPAEPIMMELQRTWLAKKDLGTKLRDLSFQEQEKPLPLVPRAWL
jgi:hypothetical protein